MKVKFYKGLSTNLPTKGEAGALYLTTDNGNLYYCESNNGSLKLISGLYSISKSGNSVNLVRNDGESTEVVFTIGEGLAISSDKVISLSITKEDITALGIPAQDTTYSEATTSKSGLMSSSDKSKLNGIAAEANKYVHPSHSSQASGLYKITVDDTGHVSAVTPATKEDISNLSKQEITLLHGGAYEKLKGSFSISKSYDITDIKNYDNLGYIAITVSWSLDQLGTVGDDFSCCIPVSFLKKMIEGSTATGYIGTNTLAIVPVATAKGGIDNARIFIVKSGNNNQYSLNFSIPTGGSSTSDSFEYTIRFSVYLIK